MALKRKHSSKEAVGEKPKAKILKKSNEVIAKSSNKTIEGDNKSAKKNIVNRSSKISNSPIKKDVTKNNFKKPPTKFINKGFNLKAKNAKTFQEAGNNAKADWKKMKLEKKELRNKRKQQKPHYTISVEMKKLYETLKRKSTKSNKEDLAKKLYELFKTNVRSFVMAHDTARIVQCVLKKASPSVKRELSEELLPLSVEMSTSKYAHFCALRILKYGDKSAKEKFIENLFGSICKLTLNQIANSIIDVIYTTHANEKQKNMMKQEFYGDLFKNSKDSNITKLSDTYKDSPQLKAGILNAVKGNLIQIANKNTVDNSLVHAVLYEYLTECQQADIEELIGIYSLKIPLLLTTRDGCQSAILMFWKAATKDRRAMVKSIKEHLLKICTHEHGHIFLIAVANCMDDTKAIKKQIFDPLSGHLEEIMQSQWGRKVVEWLVEPGSKDNFHPKLIEFFDEGLQYGKKSSEARRQEILEQIEEPIAKEIISNTSFWMANGHIALVTATILRKFSSNHFCGVAESIAKLVCDCDWRVVCSSSNGSSGCISNNSSTAAISKATTKVKEEKANDDMKISNENENSDGCLGIEDSGLHIVLKKMIKNDQLKISSNEATLGEFIIKNLKSDTITSWIKINRACFILLNILENSKDDTKNELITIVSKHVKELKTQKHAGAKLLLRKLL